MFCHLLWKLGRIIIYSGFLDAWQDRPDCCLEFSGYRLASKFNCGLFFALQHEGISQEYFEYPVQPRLIKIKIKINYLFIDQHFGANNLHSIGSSQSELFQFCVLYHGLWVINEIIIFAGYERSLFFFSFLLAESGQ